MISVEVSDEDLGDLAGLDTTLLKLDLRSLPAVKYPDTSVILIRDWRGSRREADNDYTQLKCRTGDSTPRCGKTTGGAEKYNFHVFVISLQSLKDKESYLEDQWWRLEIFIFNDKKLLQISSGQNYLHQDYSVI